MKKWFVAAFAASIVLLAAVGVFVGGIDDMGCEPPLDTRAFLESQPYFSIGALRITQPSTAIITLFVAALSLTVALFFTRTARGNSSRGFLAWALIGISAAAVCSAVNTAFAYELRAAKWNFVLYSSWFEIAYLSLVMWSVAAVVVALSYAGSRGAKQTAIFISATAYAFSYAALLALAVVYKIRFVISLDFLVICLVPPLVFLLVDNAVLLKRTRFSSYRKFLVSFVILCVGGAAYFAFSFFGVCDILFAKTGLWLSARDLLHLSLAAWLLYCRFTLRDYLWDVKN